MHLVPCVCDDNHPSTLPGMALDGNLDTKKYASKAMIAAARDYNGRTALLKVSAKRAVLGQRRRAMSHSKCSSATLTEPHRSDFFSISAIFRISTT